MEILTIYIETPIADWLIMYKKSISAFSYKNQGR